MTYARERWRTRCPACGAGLEQTFAGDVEAMFPWPWYCMNYVRDQTTSEPGSCGQEIKEENLLEDRKP